MFCCHWVKYIIKPSLLNQTNIRFASKYARSSILTIPQHHVSIIREKFDENRPLSKAEWDDFRQKLLNLDRNITKVNVDTVILGHCLPSQLNIGKAYVNYLKESGMEPNTATYGRLLKLHYAASRFGAEITDDEQHDIINIHNYLRNKYPVLDASTSENVIQGLVLTKEWRKSLELIDMINVLSKPSTFTYCVIIQRALEDRDENLVWKLFYDMMAECKVPTCDVFMAYISFCRENSSKFSENIDKILTFIGESEILVSFDVINKLQCALKDFGYTSNITSIKTNGECQSCCKKLNKLLLTDDEFERLSDKFLDKVLVGSNVFHKSTPEEMETFIQFIDKTKPYDCVIDGLNVAYTKNESQQRGSTKSSLVAAQMVADVVQYFVNQKKVVLVIGRRHMERWPRTQMNFIRKNSNLFFTENLSNDDPFFLYAALKSGSKTDFVSRDLMRNHAFALGNDLKLIFRRWQQQHQYKIKYVNHDGRVRFHKPIEFSLNAHKLDGCWHIPFITDGKCTIPPDSFNVPKNWLCVSKRH